MLLGILTVIVGLVFYFLILVILHLILKPMLKVKELSEDLFWIVNAGSILGGMYISASIFGLT